MQAKATATTVCPPCVGNSLLSIIFVFLTLCLNLYLTHFGSLLCANKCGNKTFQNCGVPVLYFQVSETSPYCARPERNVNKQDLLLLTEGKTANLDAGLDL